MEQRGSAMKLGNRFAAIAVAILILLSGANVANARTVRVGIPGHNITQAAFYAARDRGWYRDEGLEVQLIMMPAPVSNLALIAGNVDFTSVPAAAIRGAPLGCYLPASISLYFGFMRNLRFATSRGSKIKRSGPVASAPLKLCSANS